MLFFMDLTSHTALNIHDVMEVYREKSWVLWSHAVSIANCDLYKKSLQQMDRDQKFTPAGIGKGAHKLVSTDIRSDRILWFSDGELILHFPKFQQCLTSIMETMNQQFFLGLRQFEIHGAIYGSNQRYLRHLDQHRGSHQRIVTVVFYLNESWLLEHGGALELFDDQINDSVSIPPLSGDLLLFDSTRFEHQVKTSFKDRYSLTGWFRQDGML
jgi:SM-20-related protein